MVLPHHTFLDPSHFHYQSKRIRNCALGASFIGMEDMSDFIKFCKVVVELNAGTRQALTIHVFVIFVHVLQTADRLADLVSPVMSCATTHALTHFTHKPI